MRQRGTEENDNAAGGKEETKNAAGVGGVSKPTSKVTATADIYFLFVFATCRLDSRVIPYFPRVPNLRVPIEK